jgi:WD40 repeat protein
MPCFPGEPADIGLGIVPADANSRMVVRLREAWKAPGTRSLLEAILRRGLLDRIGVPGLVSGALALVYAATAWWLTPKTDGLPWGLGGEGHNPAITGAWLPLIVLAAGGTAALGLANPSGTAKLFRGLLSRVPVLSLSFAFLMLPLAGSIDFYAPQSDERIFAIVAVASVASLAAARGLFSLFFLSAQPQSLYRRAAGFAFEALLLWLGALLLLETGGISKLLELSSSLAWLDSLVKSPSSLAFLAVAVIALLVCGAALLANKFFSRPPARRPARLPMRFGGALRVAAALALILPAVITGHIVRSTSAALVATVPGSSAVAETEDGQFLAIGGADGRIQIYDTRSAEPAPSWTIDTEHGSIASLAIAHLGRGANERSLVVAATHANGRVSVRHADGSRANLAWAEREDARSHGQAAFVALGPGGQLVLAVEGSDGQALLIGGSRKDQRLALGDSGAATALVALDVGRFAVGTLDGALHIVTTSEDGALSLQSSPAPLRFEYSRAHRLKYDSEAGLLTAPADDGSVIEAKLAAGKVDLLAQGKPDARIALGRAVPFRPAKKSAEPQPPEPPLQYEDEAQHLVRTFKGHTNTVKSVAFSPDGRTALSGGSDNKLMLWDIASGRELRSLTGHKEVVKSVAISPDGRFALSGGWDDTVKLWDISEWTTPRKSARIVHAGHVYSTLPRDCLGWPSESVLNRGGADAKKSPGWGDYYPKDGDQGEIIAEVKHCDGHYIYILKVGQNYVPIGKAGWRSSMRRRRNPRSRGRRPGCRKEAPVAVGGLIRNAKRLARPKGPRAEIG